MKKIYTLSLLILSSCGVIKFQREADYSYKYVELPSTDVKIGHSNELFEPCDTITEFPSKRKFVVKAIRMRGDTTWVNCPEKIK